MEWEIYDLDKNEDGFTYEFFSDGPKGRIKKIIQFQHLNDLGKNVFNLSFGDFDEVINRINDRIVSNNGDQLKILHTVAETVIDFFRLYPEAIILIEGCSSSRTRLYQMKIAAFWSAISQQFEIWGESESKWLPFQKGENYKRLLIYKKIK